MCACAYMCVCVCMYVCMYVCMQQISNTYLFVFSLRSLYYFGFFVACFAGIVIVLFVCCLCVFRACTPRSCMIIVQFAEVARRSVRVYVSACLPACLLALLLACLRRRWLACLLCLLCCWLVCLFCLFVRVSLTLRPPATGWL